MGLALDIIYCVGLVVASPFLLVRMMRHNRYRTGKSQRIFGSVPVRYGRQPIVWVHGVSLGEVNAARGLVDELHSQLPDYQVVISTSTDTGITQARKLFEPRHWVFQWPMDFSLTVRRALKRLRPDLVVLMEGELWPNFLAACKRRDIPVACVNARISDNKGYPRYRKMGRFARPLFRPLSAVGAQTQTYADRFAELGTPAENVHVTGMMKFDSAHVSDQIDGQVELAAAMGLSADEQLIVAGGTGPGEEQLLLNIWPKLAAANPKARLAIVPRKPERFEEVARLIEAAGHQMLRRTLRADGCTDSADNGAVILGDTMGELRKFYALASAVFVGRSLVPMGGSDMIEAAAMGKPTAFGPHTFNFPQAEDLAANGCVRVADENELVEQLTAWLADSAAAAQAGLTAQDYVRSQQGATRRNVEMICGLLGRRPAERPGNIATVAIAAENH
jgi:3-deoxy-D-manno-octulosonic-acid transferase